MQCFAPYHICNLARWRGGHPILPRPCIMRASHDSNRFVPLQGQILHCLFFPRTHPGSLMPLSPQAAEPTATPGTPEAIHAGRRPGTAVPPGQPLAAPSTRMLNMPWTCALANSSIHSLDVLARRPPLLLPACPRHTRPTRPETHPQIRPCAGRKSTPSRPGPTNKR